MATSPGCRDISLVVVAGRRCRLALAACLLAAFAAAGAAAFEPVSHKGSDATIQLSLLGTYRGGLFADRAAEVPPAYDVNKRRLYYLAQSRSRIDILNIQNPSQPRKEGSIDLGPAGQGAAAIAFRSGVLAIAFQGPTKSSPGTVAFVDRDGRAEALPVRSRDVV